MKWDEAEEFLALVDELEALYGERTQGGGFPTDVAARKQHIERVIVEALSADTNEDQRRQHRRVACVLQVIVRQGSRQESGVVRDLGVGGAFVETQMVLARDHPIELEVARSPGVFEHGLKVRGVVVWVSSTASGPRGIGAAFSAMDEGSERRLRRFVLELLRRRAE